MFEKLLQPLLVVTQPAPHIGKNLRLKRDFSATGGVEAVFII